MAKKRLDTVEEETAVEGSTLVNGCSCSMNFDFYNHPCCHSDLFLFQSLFKRHIGHYFQSASFTSGEKNKNKNNTEHGKQTLLQRTIKLKNISSEKLPIWNSVDRKLSNRRHYKHRRDSPDQTGKLKQEEKKKQQNSKNGREFYEC